MSTQLGIRTILALAIIAAFLAPTIANAQPVNIPDANLKAAIMAELGITTDPTQADMLNLTTLSAYNAGISDLTGLEYASDLIFLDLGGNQISDLAPLEGLRNLQILYLGSNQISDLAPLEGLTNLYDLRLESNQISDLSPLASLMNLGYLYLNQNPLSQAAYDTWIPQIIANNPGIVISYDPEPRTLHVPAEYATIQDAINDAANRDTVLVADGVYQEEGIDFYSKAVTLRSENGPDHCTIDFSLGYGGIYWQETAAVLDGFTITGGDESAVLTIEDGGSPTIQNCIIAWNQTQWEESLIRVYGEYGAEETCTPVFRNCLIMGNEINSDEESPASVIRSSFSEPMFINCEITGNYHDGGNGGIIRCCGGHPQFIGCVITDNISENLGGGFYVTAFDDDYGLVPTQVDIISCLIEGNQANSGGGLYVEEGAQVNLRNCQITGNSGGIYGGGVYAKGSTVNITGGSLHGNIANYGPAICATQNSHLTLVNSILWSYPGLPNSGLAVMFDAKVWVAYCDMAGGKTGVQLSHGGTLVWGFGIIQTDPGFAQSGSWIGSYWSSGDYHIGHSSPCHDTGKPDYVPQPYEQDIDQQYRLNGPRVDIGADEFAYPGDSTHDGAVNAADLASLADHWLIACELTTGWCGDNDANHDGVVNLIDLAILAEYWLAE